ncbi:MAG: hypothetical protein KF862_07530 [Chitinophagaceae bacterium]|nr:hypothetical protein [Chitinophagaceae bacterium]
MKNRFSLLAVVLVIIISCEKKEILLAETAAITQAAGDTIQWVQFEDLPEKYRSAKRVVMTEDRQDAVSKRLIETSYGPYGNTSGGDYFGFPISNHRLLMIAIGTYDGRKPNQIMIWAEDPDGVLVMYTSQEPGASSLQLRYTVPGEYIRGVGGYYGECLNRLEIYTNVTALSMGELTGTRFIDIPGTGFDVSRFYGFTGLTKISRLYFQAAERPWSPISGSAARDIAVDTAGKIYKVSRTTGSIYQRAANAASWLLMSGTENSERIAANAGRVYIIRSSGRIYRLSGTTWTVTATDCPGGAKDIAVDANGKLWVVTKPGYIYTLEGNSWVKQPGSSGYRIGAGGVAGQNSQVWLVNSVGKIYNWNATQGKWEQRAGSDGIDITVDNHYNTWLTNSIGRTYRYDYARKDWIEFKTANAGSVSANANKLVMMNSVGTLYEMRY